MALTELQRPDKARFYFNIQRTASEVYELMNKWRGISDFIANIGVSDLDDIGIPIGQVRTDLVKFRTAIQEILSLYDGNPVTPTNPPDDVINVMRSM